MLTKPFVQPKMEDKYKCYYTRRLNIHHTVLYYCIGKLAPEKVTVVVPLEQVRKEGRRAYLANELLLF